MASNPAFNRIEKDAKDGYAELRRPRPPVRPSSPPRPRPPPPA